MNSSKQLIGSGAVARRVGLKRSQLLYLLDSGQLPEPNSAVPGRRLFTNQDIERIEAALRDRPDLLEGRRQAGHLGEMEDNA